MHTVKEISETTKISQNQIREMLGDSRPKIIWKYVMPTSAQREVLNNPLIQNIDTIEKARSIFFDRLTNPKSSIVVLTAILAKWIMLCSTIEEALIPCKIAIRNKCFPVEALAIQTICFF